MGRGKVGPALSCWPRSPGLAQGAGACAAVRAERGCARFLAGQAGGPRPQRLADPCSMPPLRGGAWNTLGGRAGKGLTAGFTLLPERVVGTGPGMQRGHHLPGLSTALPGPGVGTLPGTATSRQRVRLPPALGVRGGAGDDHRSMTPPHSGTRPLTITLRDRPGPGAPHAPSPASSTWGPSPGHTLARRGFYYPASQVIRSDVGSWDVSHPISEQMLLGPPDPGQGSTRRVPAALSCLAALAPPASPAGAADAPPAGSRLLAGAWAAPRTLPVSRMLFRWPWPLGTAWPHVGSQLLKFKPVQVNTLSASVTPATFAVFATCATGQHTAPSLLVVRGPHFFGTCLLQSRSSLDQEPCWGRAGSGSAKPSHTSAFPAPICCGPSWKGPGRAHRALPRCRGLITSSRKGFSLTPRPVGRS